jgi:hypothetical protein
MGTIRTKLALSLAVAVAGLASFAGTAGAFSFNSIHSVASQYQSAVGGTCVADDYAAAGNVSRGAPVYGWTDYFPYDNC